jgi:Glycine/D-amino acid oxidases (deaminating)
MRGSGLSAIHRFPDLPNPRKPARNSFLTPPAIVITRHVMLWSVRTIVNTPSFSGEDPGAMTETVPSHAQVVVIGAGVVGASVAYHLAALGCRDVVLLERAKIGSGTSWHAAGNMETYRADPLIGEMIRYAVDFYPGWRRRPARPWAGARRAGSCSPPSPSACRSIAACRPWDAPGGSRSNI